ncbi:DUF7319 domain-containing protein [Halobaculum magnesiiphilum]|uniref:DUF7319 domain-containing protein n=1 Tax=Halobaculum magnesiiphilum TaxID=1017351 RepID=A0A8T8WC05_9EURY|nr:hypothetical protein [Halobaculum magnesiiphilum]QZP37351.1 hypothetical protein K6T50_13875 [Halobaculum magnesiiphilum]
MTDAADEPERARAVDTGSVEDASDDSIEALRAEVEEKYDFDDFGPADMAEMTEAEWDAAFDPDAWITGRDLLDRVERDLRSQIASREVFAVLDRRNDPPSVVAYSDEGWAVVYDDGSVEGEGTVLRDVKPTVALCSMDSYEVRDPPEEYELPTPEEVESGTGEFGNLMIQVVAAMQILGGLGLFVAWLFLGVETIVAPVMGGFFLVVGVLLFGLVANARLSDRFRAEEYRDRLRAAGITDPGDDAEFVPFEEVAEEALAAARGEGPDPPETTVSPSGDTEGSADAAAGATGPDARTGATGDETDG